MSISISEIVMLVIGVILLVNLLPVGLAQFYSTNTASWSVNGSPFGANDSATNAIWRLFPLIGVLAAFLLIAIPVIKRL